jgi:hypothetical protein
MHPFNNDVAVVLRANFSPKNKVTEDYSMDYASFKDHNSHCRRVRREMKSGMGCIYDIDFDA